MTNMERTSENKISNEKAIDKNDIAEGGLVLEIKHLSKGFSGKQVLKDKIHLRWPGIDTDISKIYGESKARLRKILGR